MSKQRTTLGHVEFYKLTEWIKSEDKAKRLEGLDAETLAARAQKDLAFSLTETHVKNIIRMLGIKWTSPQNRGRHLGNGVRLAAVAADLRSLAKHLVLVMDELGVDKTKSIYQETVKISAVGGYREENAA